MQLPVFLKKNNYLLGAFLGLVLPILFYLLLLVLDMVFSQIVGHSLTRKPHLLYLLSTVVNLFPIRHYLVKLKLEKSGLGLLAVTAMLILAYFFLFFNH